MPVLSGGSLTDRKRPPPKTPEEYAELKETIRSDGKVRDPLVVWKEDGILLDGHHRDRVCKELGFKPPIDEISFANRDAAKMWVLLNQFTLRRNLNSFQKVEAALKFKEYFTAKAKANQRAAGGAVPLKSVKPVVAVNEVAKLAGVSPDTVRKVERILENASKPDVAEAIGTLRRGDAVSSINSVWQRFCVKREMEIHRYGKIFPLATEKELNVMVKSIRRIGLRKPIVLYEGKILDGKVRYKACEMAGVEPHYEEYDSEKHGHPLDYIFSHNWCRRDLSEEQYALTEEDLKNAVRELALDKLKDSGGAVTVPASSETIPDGSMLIQTSLYLGDKAEMP